MPLWVSGGGDSQLRWMVLFCSWLTLMDTVCGEALGTAQLYLCYCYILNMVSSIQTTRTHSSPVSGTLRC